MSWLLEVNAFAFVSVRVACVVIHAEAALVKGNGVSDVSRSLSEVLHKHRILLLDKALTLFRTILCVCSMRHT
jgi:hypothetical protein